MTDNQYGSARRTVALVTTALVSLGTAAAVGWAAAVPVGGSAATTNQPSNNQAAVQTAHQIDGARTRLQHVRRDLRHLVGREDDLPRAKLANLPALSVPLPSVQVPQSSVPQSSVQPSTTHVTAPPTHTTTGASGAHP